MRKVTQSTNNEIKKKNKFVWFAVRCVDVLLMRKISIDILFSTLEFD